MEYRREIDGLRALAVLPVILFHAGFETFSGGFVGVDVFFVISGYLITTIILAELEQGKFSIINFYERRARRILPALFLVMLVCIPLAWFWMLPSDMKNFSQSLIAVAVFASNIFFWRESGYFDTAAELKPLLHTWSLAVEEQYYVLYPLFLMLFWRIGKRWILILLAIVGIMSLALAQWASLTKPGAAFYLLPTRGWELLIGAFAALYFSQANRKDFGKGLSEVSGWLGVFLILYAVFAYSKTTPFPGFYALVPTLGTVLVILFATPQTSVGKFVGNKAFVGIGLISYSAYLWHQPLLAFARHRSLVEQNDLVFFFLPPLALVIAYFSWKFVEAPFRNRSLFLRNLVFSLSAVLTAFFICVGFLGYKSILLPKNNHLGLELDYSAHFVGWSNCNLKEIIQDDDGGCAVIDPSKPIDYLVIGDSHSGHFASGFLELSKKIQKNFAVILRAGCFPGLNVKGRNLFDCEYNQIERAFNYAAQNPEIEYVILSGYGMGKLSGSRPVDGTTKSIDPIRIKEFKAGFEKAVQFLIQTAKKVIVISDTPELLTKNPGRCLISNECESLKIQRIYFDERNSVYLQILQKLEVRFKDIKIKYPHFFVCDAQYCYATMNGILLYQSDDHLTPYGGRFLIEKMFE